MEKLHLLPIFLLAVSTSLDNFGVGISYGMRCICIPVAYNIMIAAINSAGTIISMSIGERIYRFIQPETAGYTGSAIFIAAGGWLIIRAIYNKLRGVSPAPGPEEDRERMAGRPFLSKTLMVINRPDVIGLHCAGHIGFKESWLLALALTFSNLVTGVGAGLVGLDITLTTMAVFLAGISAVLIGTRIGGYTGRRWFGGLSDPVAGLLLIMIGIYEMVF